MGAEQDVLERLVFMLIGLGWRVLRGSVTGTELSGYVSRDAAAIRIWIQIVRCGRPAKRQKPKPCEKKARCSSPLLPVGSQESLESA